MLGPFATASRRTPIHQVSPLSHARIDVHDNDNDDDNDDNTTTLWPRGMGPKTLAIYSLFGRHAKQAKTSIFANAEELRDAASRKIDHIALPTKYN